MEMLELPGHNRRTRMHRIRPDQLAWGLGATLLVAASTPARAQTPDEKLRCVEAYEQSQRDRRDGRLLEAHRQLLACSQEACPEVVRDDCTTWLGDVEDAIPSIVVSARSRSGEDLLDARVLIDETLVTSELSGKAFELDPGQHRIQVKVEGYLPFDRTVVVAEGEKHRSVIATLEKPESHKPPPPPPPRPPPTENDRRGSPAIPVAFGAVGAAGFVGFTYFGIEARTSERRLDRCRPDCEQVDVNDTKHDYLLANVSLGVGVAGATGTLVWLIATRPRPAESSRRLRLDIAPRRGGAITTLRGSF